MHARRQQTQEFLVRRTGQVLAVQQTFFQLNAAVSLVFLVTTLVEVFGGKA